MPRTLPWLSKPSDPTLSKRRASAASSSSKKRRTISPVRDSDEVELVEPATPPNRHDELPSSPTVLAQLEPLQAPALQYMVEGYDDDDGYMMVEDEFYSTAHEFTKHLHHEEYVKHKKLHNSRNQEAKDTMKRGTDGVTRHSNELKLKQKAAETAKSIKQGLKNAELEGSPGTDNFLTRLMRQDTTSAPDLSGLRRSKVNTKAAAKIVPTETKEKGTMQRGEGHALDVHGRSMTSDMPKRPSKLDEVLRGSFEKRTPTTTSRTPDYDDSDDLDNGRSGSGVKVKPSQLQMSNKRPATITTQQDVAAGDIFTQSAAARSSALDFMNRRRAQLEQRQR